MEVRHRYRQAGAAGNGRVPGRLRSRGGSYFPVRASGGRTARPGARDGSGGGARRRSAPRPGARRCEFRSGAAFTVLSQPACPDGSMLWLSRNMLPGS